MDAPSATKRPLAHLSLAETMAWRWQGDGKGMARGWQQEDVVARGGKGRVLRQKGGKVMARTRYPHPQTNALGLNVVAFLLSLSERLNDQ